MRVLNNIFLLCVLIGLSSITGKATSKISLKNDLRELKSLALEKQDQTKFPGSEISGAEFDPWNKERWADWYDSDGKILKPFYLNEDTKFAKKDSPWELTFSKDFDAKFLITVNKQGIVLDGNGLILEARTSEQKLPLIDLFKIGKKAWSNDETCEIIGIFYQLPIQENTPASIIKNFEFRGLKRGVKITGTGEIEGHRLFVEDCVFYRNRIGYYTNGYNVMLRNCTFVENGNGAIYSGSQSRRNQFYHNTFEDNCLAQNQVSYADFIGDTFFDTEICYNTFEKSKMDIDHRRIGISFFRNMGESGKLRKQMPHNNLVKGNTFDSYTVAVNIGSRMGRDTRNDLANEGRDYAFYNTIDSNIIKNSLIGIKVNTSGNTIKNNILSNVEMDIVLHCVFFDLKATTIENQPQTAVYNWYVTEDYLEHNELFRFQDDLNQNITKEEKYISVYYTKGRPNFKEAESKSFAINPENEILLNNHRFGPPTKIVKGEFSLDLEGPEMAAIWDHPISRIKGIEYYSIQFINENGIEINRCGKSTIPWKDITTGYFDRKDGEMEVAAVLKYAVDGKYPVYIFTRGHEKPSKILYENNTDPTITVETGKQGDLIVNFGQ